MIRIVTGRGGEEEQGSRTTCSSFKMGLKFPKNTKLSSLVRWRHRWRSKVKMLRSISIPKRKVGAQGKNVSVFGGDDGGDEATLDDLWTIRRASKDLTYETLNNKAPLFRLGIDLLDLRIS